MRRESILPTMLVCLFVSLMGCASDDGSSSCDTGGTCVAVVETTQPADLGNIAMNGLLTIDFDRPAAKNVMVGVAGAQTQALPASGGNPVTTEDSQWLWTANFTPADVGQQRTVVISWENRNGPADSDQITLTVQ